MHHKLSTLIIFGLLSVTYAVHAGEWANMATYDEMVESHICDVSISPGGHVDVDCPETNPDILADGTISATAFIGNGASLTNVSATLVPTSPGGCSDGDVAAWNNSASTFECTASGGGGTDDPDAFSFTDETNVAVSTLTTSNIIQITGLTAPAPVTVSGDGSPTFRICNDNTCTEENFTWRSTEQSLINNSYLQVRLTSSANNSTTTSATVNIGSVTDNWAVTTENAITSFTTNWKVPGSVSSIGSSGSRSWGNTGNIGASDDAYTDVITYSGDDIEILRATQFGFTTADIPSGATILGIEVGIERAIQASLYNPNPRDRDVILRSSSGQTGDDKADTLTNWTSTDTEIIYGGSSDNWNASLNDADIRSSSFGIDFRPEDDFSYSGAGFLVDRIRVRIHGEY